MPQIRTRIAPSPTGDPHVGTAYIALFNRCLARRHGGRFVLRIEDTDRRRSSAGSEAKILDLLRWLGLDWDEGPDRGGGFGPYRQSERLEVYARHVGMLLEKGHAFRCFCGPERLEEVRKRRQREKLPAGYDGHCLGLDEMAVKAKLDAGEPHTVRMKVPAEGECEFEDRLRGRVSIAYSQVDMQVLLKSDGFPTYHLANVVDDHLMEISHVVRGEEWINSVPKHVLLYRYFGWPEPVFCHMPLLRNPDKSKLSKRKNPTSIGYYRDMGYLPQAVVNYLGAMGWSMPDGREKFSMDEMTEVFELSRVSLGGPVFDVEKLNWLNGKYLREDLSDEEFIGRYAEWAFAPGRIGEIVPLLKPRVELLSDVAELALPFVSGIMELDAARFEHKRLDGDATLRVLQFSLWRLERIERWDRDRVEAALKELAAGLEMKIRDFLFPLFVAVTGRAVSVSVIDAIAVLGIDLTRARIRRAVSVLGGLSKKRLGELESRFARLDRAGTAAGRTARRATAIDACGPRPVEWALSVPLPWGLSSAGRAQRWQR